MSSKSRIETLVREYGPIFIATYFVIFGLVFAGFVCAIRFGVAVDGATAAAGTFGAAYIATKLTQPLRIAAAAALTPVVGRRWGKKSS